MQLHFGILLQLIQVVVVFYWPRVQANTKSNNNNRKVHIIHKRNQNNESTHKSPLSTILRFPWQSNTFASPGVGRYLDFYAAKFGILDTDGAENTWMAAITFIQWWLSYWLASLDENVIWNTEIWYWTVSLLPMNITGHIIFLKYFGHDISLRLWFIIKVVKKGQPIPYEIFNPILVREALRWMAAERDWPGN